MAGSAPLTRSAKVGIPEGFQADPVGPAATVEFKEFERSAIEQDVENRKHQLWEQEGRIFALAAEGLDQRKRGDGPDAVAVTMQFLKTQIGHWETAYRALRQTEQALRGRN